MTLRAIALAAALAGASAGAAFAQGPPGPPSPEQLAARAACAPDVQALCSSAQGPAIGQCLRDNADKLSAECKAARAKLPAPPPK